MLLHISTRLLEVEKLIVKEIHRDVEFNYLLRFHFIKTSKFNFIQSN